jgi:hypothetical protein
MRVARLSLPERAWEPHDFNRGRMSELYLTLFYSDNKKLIDEIDFQELFIYFFKKEAVNQKDKFKTIESDISLSGKPLPELTKEEVNDFIEQGKEIISWMISPNHRSKHFPTNEYEVIGTEIPIKILLKNNVYFMGYIDLVLKNKSTNRIKIVDFKTSTRGWNEYQKKDENKIYQLILYKKFYSEQYNVDIHLIDIEFIVLKRILYENCAHPQSRTQVIVPASGEMKTRTSYEKLNKFVETCFLPGGDYNKDREYEKTPGIKQKNCKFCPYKGTNHCDAWK